MRKRMPPGAARCLGLRPGVGARGLGVAEAVPVPEVKADQVLVRVRATSLNIEDIMWGVGRRIGVYITATKEAPVILGQEFSGVVERVGAKVMKFKIGDAVLGHKVDILQITMKQ